MENNWKELSTLMEFECIIDKNVACNDIFYTLISSLLTDREIARYPSNFTKK